MSSNPVSSKRHVKLWLAEYGYESVEEMQEFYGLVVDGDTGPQTLAAMNLPRCGVKDLRLAADCKWQGKTHLTYWCGPGFNLFKRRLGKPGRKASREMIDAGFRTWARVSPFTFERRIGPAPGAIDIWIGGGVALRYDFDGPGNVLAWADMPYGKFDVLETRFDARERWTHDPNAGSTWVYALSVWLHELGHLLGLGHSRNADDIMAAYYNPDVRELQSGDIQRIQRLYGHQSSEIAVEPSSKGGSS